MSTRPSSFRAALSLGALLVFASACAHAVGSAPDPTEEGERVSDDPSVVTADDIRDRPSAEPVEQVLQGRVAGVWVTRTADGGIAVQIRGRSTFQGNAQPLYVIDGVPIQPGPGGALVGIQPYEIESIEVLKDAVSTAMYGVRGANGVILIRLKRPSSD